MGSTAGMQTSVDTSPLLKVRGNGPDPALGKLPASCLQAGFGVLFLSEGGISLYWRAWRGAGGGCSCGAIRVKPKGGCHRIGVTVTHLPRQHRAEAVVPERLALMMRHIRERDFEGFGQLAMRDSNQFHATCLDTFPPIFYLNDLSRHIIALAHRFNTHHGCTKVPAGRAGPTGLLVCCGAAVRHRVPLLIPPQVAYTFDAGPNAVIFTLADTVAEFVEVVRRSFPPAANGDQ